MKIKLNKPENTLLMRTLLRILNILFEPRVIHYWYLKYFSPRFYLSLISSRASVARERPLGRNTLFGIIQLKVLPAAR